MCIYNVYIYICLAFELSISPYSFLNGNVTFAFFCYADHDHFCYCLPNSSLRSCWATTIFAFSTARCVSLLVDFSSNKLVLPGWMLGFPHSELFWWINMLYHAISISIYILPKTLSLFVGYQHVAIRAKGLSLCIIHGNDRRFTVFSMLCWQADSYLSDSVILRSPDGTMRLGYKWGWNGMDLRDRFIYGCIWKCCVPLNPMVLLIIIPFLNGYFMGNIYPIFRQTHIYCTSLGWTWLTMLLLIAQWEWTSFKWAATQIDFLVLVNSIGRSSIWVIFGRNCCRSISPQRLFVDCTDFFHPHIPENRIIWQGYHAHQTQLHVYIYINTIC